MPLHGGQYERHQRGDCHRGEQRPQVSGSASGEDVVEEELAEGRYQQAWYDQQQAGQQDQRQRAAGGLPAGDQRLHHPGLAAARGELRAGLEREHHAGEARVEVLPVDQPGAGGRVVDRHPGPAEPLADPLVHHEVLERPEDDGRGAGLAQLLGLHLEALGDKPVPAGGGEHRGGLGAVAGHTAGHPQLLQRYEPPVVPEHHGQRGGATLDSLHLDDCRGAADAPPASPLRRQRFRGAGTGRGRSLDHLCHFVHSSGDAVRVSRTAG
jgi:hypothetical protein